MNKQNTQYFSKIESSKPATADILIAVYTALHKNGYNPISQIVGYILSGDPTYITSKDGARIMIARVDRDELLEELLAIYIQDNFEKDKVS